MRWFGSWLSQCKPTPIRRRRVSRFESLESRKVFAADPLPVLMVLADQQDFYYREYSDTKLALEAEGLDVVVAATTTNTTYPHPGTGETDGIGAVQPDVALSEVNPDNYSAIVFVGGWGASMYQYAYNDPNGDGVTDNFYAEGRYNGDDNLNDGQIAPQKIVVNTLINDFLADDKHVAAICHGVTVLAWARVDGVSPLSGRQVAVPHTVGTATQFYDGQWRGGGYYEGQYQQVLANGGLANAVSGIVGDPTTVADDVVVDGRIITAENYDSALEFGRVIALEVLANQPVINHAPTVADATWNVPGDAPVGTVIGQLVASDVDAGQTLSYSIVGGNDANLFSIDPVTGLIQLASAPPAAGMDVAYSITVQVLDNGAPALASFADVTVNIQAIAPPPMGADAVVHGTDAADTIYLWSGRNNEVFVWMNGVQHDPIIVGPGGHVRVFGGAGNDRIYATDLFVPIQIFGQAGHDLITGGHANDLLDGGDGVDRLWGGPGDDLIRGGAGNDFLYGREGNNILVGGDGDDYLEGHDGRDLLLGGLGTDLMRGGGNDDLLIGGTTSYDNVDAALQSLMAIWSTSAPLESRIAVLSDAAATIRLASGATVQDDGSADTLVGAAGADWIFASLADYLYATAEDRVNS